MIPVAAALVMKDGKVLLSQREMGGHLPLYWELPGGKVEDGEAPSGAIHRELAEELGVGVRIIEPFLFTYYEYPDHDEGILLLIYRCELVDAAPRAIGCRDIGWFSLDEIDALDTPPADDVIFEKIAASNI